MQKALIRSCGLALLFLSLSFLISFVNATTSPVWNDANFDSNLKAASDKATPVLVAFTAPWCGHCKSLAPEFVKAAERLQGKVLLVKVDATAEDSGVTAKAHDVSGFPTLKYFPSGDKPPVSYEGGRTSSAIVNWITKQTSSVIQQVSTADTIDAIFTKIKLNGADDPEMDENGAKTCIVLVTSSDSKAEKSAFEAAAKADESTRGYYETTPDSELGKALVAKYKVDPSKPTLVLFRSFDPEHPIVSSEASNFGNPEKFTAFCVASSEAPTDVTNYTDDEFRAAKQSGKPIVVMFYAPWCGYCKEFKPKYSNMATLYKERNQKDGVVVAKLDATVYESIADEETIASYPTIKLYKSGMSALYKAEVEFTADSVSKWVDEKLQAKALIAKTEAEAIELVVKSSSVATPKAMILVGKENRLDLVNRAAFEASADVTVVAVLSSTTTAEKAYMYIDQELSSSFSGPSLEGEAFQKWKARASIPPVFHFSDDFFDQVVQAKAKVLAMLFVPSAPHPLIESMTAFAKSNSDDVEAAFAYANEGDDYLLDFFGLSKTDLPALRFLDLVDPAELNTYIAVTGEEGMNQPNVWGDNLKAFRAGTLVKHVQEDPPAAEGGEEAAAPKEEEEEEDDEEASEFEEEDVDPDEDSEEDEDAGQDEQQLPDADSYEEAAPEGTENDEL